jgi:hypothetical protein
MEREEELEQMMFAEEEGLLLEGCFWFGLDISQKEVYDGVWKGRWQEQSLKIV